MFTVHRWCLKEAGYKALYPAYRPTWKEFTVLRIDNKKPLLAYIPKGCNTFVAATFHCSVSHDGDYVFSTVLAERS
jgi:holo-[acyl-carrier protein] synthase